jgi:hypothetical protein
LSQVKKLAKEAMQAGKAAALESSNKNRKAIRYYAHPASCALTMEELDQQK